MIVLNVVLTAKADKIESLHSLLSSFPPKAQREPGCIQYELFRQKGNPAVFCFFEKWADEETYKQHSLQPYLKEFRMMFDELLECPNQVLFLEPADSD